MAPKLHIYRSHEDAAVAHAKQAAMQPPVERLREAVELILRVYGVSRKELSERKKSKRITIVAYE